jgi:uncharacterized zinc-type alcohol dehydrogenase-like protein
MVIRAFSAKKAGQKLEPFTYPIPVLGPFEVLIDITHCGLCYSDVHLIDDDWKRSVYPLVPGHEVVGKIVQKGSEVKRELGTRVGVSWLYSSCLECPTCLLGETQVCPQRKATCIGHHGGFATQMTADSRFIYSIPKALDSAVAAPLLCAGATVYAPFRRWKIQAPHHVAVIGIGGLGHLALQFGRAFGCSVTAISSSSDKEKEALSFGAGHFATLDQIKANPSNYALSFDFIISTTHGDVDWDLVCSLLKPTGVLCFLGRPATRLSLDLLRSLNSQQVITGSSVANRYLIQEMLEFAAEHKIVPRIELMKMSEVNEAIEKVRKNKARYRIVLTQ